MPLLSLKRFYYLTKKSKPPITKGNTEIRIKRLTTLSTRDRGQCCGLIQTKMGPGKKLVRRNYSIFFTALRAPGKKAVFSWSLSTSWKTKAHITWFSQHRNAASQWGGGEGLRLQSQEGQDLCGAAAAGHLMFKTSTEDQTVDLTNKGMTKDSARFSPWFHSAWRTTGPIL